MPHRTAGCGKSSLRPLMAGSSPSLPDGSNPSAAIVQSASDVQCSRLLKTTAGLGSGKTLEAAQKVVEHGAPELVALAPQEFRPGDCCKGLDFKSDPFAFQTRVGPAPWSSC